MADRTVLSLPNLLTYARIAAIPLILGFALSGSSTLRWAAFGLYVAAAASDWLDGYLARRLGQTSPLGRMLDPIADKLLVTCLIVALAFDHTISAWELAPAFAIVMREILVSGLREFLGPSGVVVHVTGLAKWKTTVQLVSLALLLVVPVLPWAWLAGSVLFWAAGVLTVWTGYDYFRGAWPHLTKET